MRIFTYLFLIILVLLGVTFSCLNAQLVDINIYIGKFQLPLSLLLILTLGCGLFLGVLVIGIKYLSLKRANSVLKNKIKLVEQEVSNLRSIPLKDEH